MLSFQDILLDALDQVSIAVVAVASDRRVLFFNHAFSKLWDDAGSVELFEPNDSEKWNDRLAALANQLAAHPADYIRWQGGRIFQRSTAPITDEFGLSPGQVWVLRDVTEWKRAEQAAQERADYLKILNEIHQSILSTRSSYAIAKVVLSKVATLLPYQQSSITLLDFRHDALVIFATNLRAGNFLTEGSHFPFDTEPGGQSPYPSNEIQWIQDIAPAQMPPALVKSLQAEGVRALLNVPLVVDSQMFGVLNLYAETSLGPTPTQLETARTVSDILAVALQQARLHEQVDTTRERVQALSRRQIELEENQRREIARDLHDMVGQNLTALNFNLHAIRRQLPADTPATVPTRLDDSSHLVEEIVARIRNMMADLRPSILDDLGLPPALGWYAGEFSARTGIRTFVDAEEVEPRLPQPTETALFRIAQEALTNVAKHAHARQVNIQLEARHANVTLKIIDDGIGFDFPAMRRNNDKTGVGLVDMRERAEGVGGRIWVECQPGEGTRVLIDVPR